MRARVDASLLRVSHVKKRDPGKTLSNLTMATSQPVYSVGQTSKNEF